MSGIKDQDNLEKMRERLYERGSDGTRSQRPKLTPTDTPVNEQWSVPSNARPHSSHSTKSTNAPAASATPETTTTTRATATASSANQSTMRTRRQKFRFIMLVSGVAVFVLSLAIASVVILTGANTISGENISLEMNGPQAVGGGENLDIQVGIGNDNSVPINAATLIIDYPTGSRAAGDGGGQDLFKERIPLDTIRSGEVVNVPIEAVVFGEEGEEKTVNASIEYRVEGSNQVFYKEASPFTFQISSVPLVVSVDTVDRTASGQSVDVVVTLRSNAQSPLTNVLVDATYPAGFSYESASPEPASGNDIWYIASIDPEEEVEITLTGEVSGSDTDELAISFDAGTAPNATARTLETVLTTADANITIEAPFIGVDLSLNGETGNVVAAPQGADRLRADISVDNNLTNSVYDMRVEATVSGNALTDEAVAPGVAFYDSTADTLEWDVTSVSGLSELSAGTSEGLSFQVDPIRAVTNPELTVSTNVYAKRIAEEQATEQLIGTAEGTIRFSGTADLLADIGRGGADFTEVGPVPPVAEQETTYTIGLRAEAGINALEGAEVSATLPSYVLWREQTTGDGRVSFNPVSRQLTWDIGDIPADSGVNASFQVGFIPSVSQTGDRPELMTAPQFVATDKFTKERITARSERITTQLPAEAGFGEESGKVQPRD